MKNKSFIFAILIISLLFLAACKSAPKATATGFIGGSDGLTATIAIESTSGGNKVYDSNVDPFKIDVTLQNKGEYDVKESEALVTLDGINFNAFQIRDPTQRNTLPLLGLRRDSGRITNPTQTIIQYDANYQPDEDADRNVAIAANFCYKYETISRVSDLCLRKQITGPQGNATCKVDESKLAENSGSPVKVKTVSQRPAGEMKINVLLEAENVGKGLIYQKDFLGQGKCVDSDSDKNKLYVKVELLEYLDQSATMIKCSGLNSNEGTVNVIQNKVQLSCDIDTSSITQETAFKTPLRVTFDYVYKNSVSTTLTVKSAI